MKQVFKIGREEEKIKTIYKYNLPDTTGLFDISMHPVYSILKVDIQDEKPVFWATVYQEEPKRNYQIISLWTGMTFKEEYGTYIGTLTIGGLVNHYFIREIYE
jgi:hypothetical protein